MGSPYDPDPERGFVQSQVRSNLRGARRYTHCRRAVSGIGTNAAKFTLTATGTAEDAERDGAFPDHRAARGAVVAEVISNRLAALPEEEGEKKERETGAKKY